MSNSVNASITNKSLDLGAGSFTKNGSGVSGNIYHEYKVGGHVAVKGQVSLINDPNHQATAWAQHQRNLDKNFRLVGPATNSAGVNYEHKNGATVFASGSKIGNYAPVGTVGATVPLTTSKDGNTNFSLNGQSTFGHGMKPNNSVGLHFSKRF